MAQVLRDTIYTTDLKADLHSQSLYTRVKLAFTFREVDPTGEVAYNAQNPDALFLHLLQGLGFSWLGVALVSRRFFRAVQGGVDGEEAEGNFCYDFLSPDSRFYFRERKELHTGGGSSDGTAAVDNLFVHPLLCQLLNYHHQLFPACNSRDSFVDVISGDRRDQDVDDGGRFCRHGRLGHHKEFSRRCQDPEHTPPRLSTDHPGVHLPGGSDHGVARPVLQARPCWTSGTIYSFSTK